MYAKNIRPSAKRVCHDENVFLKADRALLTVESIIFDGKLAPLEISVSYHPKNMLLNI